MSRRTQLWWSLALAVSAAIYVSGVSVPDVAKMPPNDGPGPKLTHDLVRAPGSPPTWHLLPQDTSDTCGVTPLFVDPRAYQDRCAPSNGPCFTHVGASLTGVHISPWLEALNMTDEIVLADDSAQAFTVLNASDAFEINYLSLDRLRFRYSNYDPSTKCYDVQLNRRDEPTYRMSVGETADDRALDTLHGTETATRLCAHQLVINIRKL